MPSKTNNIVPAYTVIRDTREQKGWTFESSPACLGTVIQTMKTGDYTLVGLEHIFTVERKRNVAEFAGNILQKRFENELVRMEAFPLAFVVCEFTYEDIWRWPIGSGLPIRQAATTKMSKHFIMKRLMDFETKYKTKFILAGPYAKDVVSSLFKRVNETYGGKPPVRTKRKIT